MCAMDRRLAVLSIYIQVGASWQRILIEYLLVLPGVLNAMQENNIACVLRMETVPQHHRSFSSYSHHIQWLELSAFLCSHLFYFYAKPVLSIWIILSDHRILSQLKLLWCLVKYKHFCMWQRLCSGIPSKLMVQVETPHDVTRPCNSSRLISDEFKFLKLLNDCPNC